MFDFRKVLLGAAVASLGLVGTASAQVSCSPTITPGGGTPTIAVEGVTEFLNPLTIACGAGTAANTVTMTLTSNVPFTNVTTVAAPGFDIQAAVTTTTTPVAASTIVIGGTNNTVLTATFNVGGALMTGLSFTGIRVNASAVPSSSVVTMTAGAIAGGGVVYSSNPTAQTAANVLISQATPAFPAAGAYPANQTLCTIDVKGVYNVTNLTVQENFAAAFKTTTDYSVAGSTAASQGTRLAVTFNNLNANVNYYVPATITNGTLTLTAMAAATGSTAATANSAAVGVVAHGNAGPFAAGTVIPLTVASGSATVYYAVTAELNTAVESAAINLYETVLTPASVTAVTTSLVSASSTLVGVATGYPEFTATVGATVTPASTVVSPNQGLLQACTTTLLFPYVVNSSGFDTGIVITNASTGVSTAVPAITAASGTCSVNFYGSAAPTAAYPTGVIASGANVTFAASAQAPGLNGYAVATCSFPGAHGYAFVFSGAGTPAAYAADYLAVIIQSGVALTSNF